MMPRRVAALVVVFTCAPALAAQQAAFTFPFDVVRGAREHARLDRGEPVVTILRGTGRELHVVALAPTTAAPEQLLAAAADLDLLQKGNVLVSGGRFSPTPELADVAALTLGDGDLKDLRDCRIGACDVKLSEPEIRRVQQTIASAGRDWKPAIQRLFREILVARARAYRIGGHAGLAPYRDKAAPLALLGEFDQVIRQRVFTPWIAPGGVDHTLLSRAVTPPVLDTFLSWSVDAYGGKPVIAITHTTVFGCAESGRPEAMLVSKQVSATHYFTGSLAMTALTRQRGGRYLVYVNSSRLDIFDGFVGGFARRMVEGRIRDAAPEALDRFRRNLERVPTASAR
jgi:hypothetical protein